MEWQFEETKLSEIRTESEKVTIKLQVAVQKLEALENNLDGWKTSGQNLDNGTYRGILKQKCSDTRIDCEKLAEELQKIKSKAEKLEKSEGNGAYDRLNEILSEIYLLGVDEDINTEDLIAQINTLAMESTDNQMLSSEDISNLISLRDMMLLYEEYLQLQKNLVKYMEESLKTPYQIDIENEDKRNEWMDKRNQDFNSFYTYVNMLPELDEEEQSGGNEFTVGDNVLETASKMQRDLLGNLTDFERAFSYFKYGFPMMAYFSVFVSVFFDLGAFFTGCFLYIAEYFEVAVEEEECKNRRGE